jgi:dual specificity MAP kinase phosphatase
MECVAEAFGYSASRGFSPRVTNGAVVLYLLRPVFCTMSTSSTSSTLPTSPTSTNVIHGLNYPQNFLKRLRTVKSNSRNPIRVLDIEGFASLHLAHLTAHAPDAVLFPFLHGLEGENHAQNHFFGVAHDRPVRVPQFRGLIWVFCEDDLVLHSQPGAPEDVSMHHDEDEDEGEGEDDQFSADSSDSLETDNSAMDIDAADPDPPIQDVHMHPVARRERLEPITIPEHARRGSDASSDSSPSPFSQQSAPSTSATSLPTSSSFYAQQSHAVPNQTIPHTLLTSSFRPAQLLCRDPSTGHLLPEFVPVKVPDGISLRNFGIQMVGQFYVHITLEQKN